MTIESVYPIGSTVKVYWNLHKHLYSIQRNGIVVGHARSIILEDVTVNVSEAGRQRVLATGHKTVHAYVCGTLFYAHSLDSLKLLPTRKYQRKMTYNPIKHDTFYVDGAPFFNSERALMQIVENRSNIYVE